MNRAYVAAVQAAAADLAHAASELLAAHSNAAGVSALQARIPADHWPPAVTAQAEQRLKDAQWRHDYQLAGLRRLTTKEPA